MKEQKNGGEKNNIDVDAAVINIGGIRSTIGAGDILTKHVFEVMPFENEVVIVKMKGSDLRGLFQYYLEKYRKITLFLIFTSKQKTVKSIKP